ncbi:uncharacterized protein LOC131938392 isoform X2 [Physella acuta]|uniref:uncharacterized protein LOC131938392 isoform X2 n=1 Tax=Physella acuta TaxID=109671 RepID=UPI0027DBB5F1|nr:uncharacterized protein LOC131938392 isoform X2 [Physella acuta]
MGNSSPATQSAVRSSAIQNNSPNIRRPKTFSAFSAKQKDVLLKRYQFYDSSAGGSVGIPLDICLAMPEFVGNKLIGVLIHDFANPKTGCLHQEEFLNFCSFLSPLTKVEEKKLVLFDCFNVYKTKTLTHDEIFRLYKVLLGHTISDDHILSLTFEALQHPKLRNKGEIQRDEFIEMAPDSEVEEKLSVHFNVPAG